MIPAAADCFWVSAISRTRMYEFEVYYSVTKPMIPDQRLSKVIKARYCQRAPVSPVECSPLVVGRSNSSGRYRQSAKQEWSPMYP